MKEFLIVAAALGSLALAGSIGQTGAQKAGLCQSALAGATCLEGVQTLKAETPD